MSDSIPYSVLETFEEVEVRQYPSIVLAMVRGLPGDEAFGILFRYISGQNRTHRGIEMTVPVISDGPSSRRIPMTRPVLSDEGSFSFVMPPSLAREDVPEPSDERVRLVDIGARKLAVLRFSGRLRKGLFGERRGCSRYCGIGGSCPRAAPS
jgi:hypothetical protein